MMAHQTQAAAQEAPSPADAGPAQPRYDVRNFVWGIGKEDVRAYESATFYREEEDTLFFLEQGEDGFRRLIRYDFRGGRLYRAEYEFQEYTLPNATEVLMRYQDYVGELSRNYGEPQNDEFIWENRRYARHPSYWGPALLAGDLSRRTVWRFGDTLVTARLAVSRPHYSLGYVAQQVEEEGPRTILDDAFNP